MKQINLLEKAHKYLITTYPMIKWEVKEDHYFGTTPTNEFNHVTVTGRGLDLKFSINLTAYQLIPENFWMFKDKIKSYVKQFKHMSKEKQLKEMKRNETT